MKKGIHPQMQWISYVTPSGRLIHAMMAKINEVGKFYQLRPKQHVEKFGQIAKFNQKYGKKDAEPEK
ncbi:hypothetical protein ACS0TY_007804 [Phlomoides rotata]